MVIRNMIILAQLTMHLLNVKLCYGDRNTHPVQYLRILKGTADVHKLMPFAVILESLKPMLRRKPSGGFIYKFRICTGSMITTSWVLTAGHCIKDTVKRIRYGDVNAPDNATNTFSIVIRKFAHPTFRNMMLPLIKNTINDIGLIQMEPVPLIQFARISAVDYPSMLGQTVFIAGFGKTGRSAAVDMHLPLQVAQVGVIKCPEDIGGPYICYTHYCGKVQSTAPGDSGGPMLYEGMLAGVCTGIIRDKTSVGVFTAVSPFLHWIRSTVKRYDKI